MEPSFSFLGRVLKMKALNWRKVFKACCVTIQILLTTSKKQMHGFFLNWARIYFIWWNEVPFPNSAFEERIKRKKYVCKVVCVAHGHKYQTIPLREKCPYSEFSWSVLSRIWNEYGEILRISPYSVQMWKNTDQKNSEYEHFLRSV